MSTDFATGTDAADTFEYDDAGRIQSWERDGFGSGTAAYEFDAAGNLKSKTRGTGTTSYSYNAGNQLTVETSGSVETTHGYDEFGRLVRSASPSSVTTYTWDPLGHLSQVATEGATATYEYGISGMREAKTVVSAEGTRTVKSVWAGMQLVAELDSDGTRYEYIYGGGIPLELVVTNSGATERYAYQVDAGGSVIGITDEDGDEVAKYAYDPYGVPTGVLGSDPLVERNPLRYRGYYFDTETGNYYMPARYYAPESARFLSVDPAPPKAGDPVSINRYAYCEADPVQYDDPKGEGLIEAYRADELDGGEAARSEAAHIQAANHLPAGKAKTHHEAAAANLRVVIAMAASLCMPCHPVAPPLADGAAIATYDIEVALVGTVLAWRFGGKAYGWLSSLLGPVGGVGDRLAAEGEIISGFEVSQHALKHGPTVAQIQNGLTGAEYIQQGSPYLVRCVPSLSTAGHWDIMLIDGSTIVSAWDFRTASMMGEMYKYNWSCLLP
ncbi:MAG: RHS repeat-associated core domain-containing protein [Coriobacteriia bacterium]|nr:RHS repeat-associated core domain-containing protein [Coriobacteriia bacterium]